MAGYLNIGYRMMALRTFSAILAYCAYQLESKSPEFLDNPHSNCIVIDITLTELLIVFRKSAPGHGGRTEMVGG